MGEQHLDPLALSARLLECGRVVEGSGHIAGLFIDVAGDLAMGRVRAALQFEGAQITVDLLRPIEQRPAVMNATSRSEQLALRAHIDIARGIEGEVGPGESAIITSGSVEHRYMRGDRLVLDQPGEHGCSAIGRYHRPAVWA